MQGRVFSPDRRKKWVPGNKLNILLQPFTSLASYGGRSGTTAFELVYTTTVGRVGGWSVGREWRGGGGGNSDLHFNFNYEWFERLWVYAELEFRNYSYI